MAIKMKCLLCVMLMIACVGMSEATVVSWDGASSDITGLGSNINTSPNDWATDLALDSAWSTTDEVVAAVGSQASFKAAIGRLPGQRRIAQINAGSNQIFVGGNELAGSATSPYTTLVGFDTSAFGAEVLKSISVRLRTRPTGDDMDVRWFVEAGGSTYVSGVVDSLTGAGYKTLTLSDARTILWYVFDADANIGSAISDANSLMELSDVTRVGYHTTSSFTADANWHGAYMNNFSAETLRFTAIDPDPADGEVVLETPILNWTAGDAANAHDVYFDTVNPPVAYMGRQTATSYDPNTVLGNGVYYWRIDEVDDPNIPVGDPANVWEGDVWSFEIGDPGLPRNPSPADEATDIDVEPTLTWTPGLNAIAHDVWFGEAADALELVADDIGLAEYTPSTLSKGRTYYWAVY